MDASELDAWREADRLFSELLDLDPALRAGRLAAMTIADEVRDRLATLLASDARSRAWLDGGSDPMPVWARHAHPLADGSLRGRRLGAWEIDEELGRGGMAVVYRARRIDGAASQVAALKLLGTSSLGREGAGQFRREVDILARVVHPHVVGLLDAGVAEDGTPWLAMPLVEGEHIDAWCERKVLATRDVVTLFLQVAAAVAAAHRHLVVHRDLKPSNVLVDRDGQARLLDFGIARLVSRGDDATNPQWRALTPDYAAPEQFHGAAPTTATDIHGLGALLHRLLTGHPPRATVKTLDLPAPSKLAADARGGAARHVRALRDDLDRVLLKALAADPAQRYGTVDELIVDLQRWLAGRPVIATAPTRRYRLRKFIARHRSGVAAAAALAIALAAGIGGTLWQARQARLQAIQATAMKDFVLDLFAAANPDFAEGEDPPASVLLGSGARRVRAEFAARPLVLAEMLAMIGRAQLERGLLDDAQSSLDEAVAAFARQATPSERRAVAIGDHAMLAYERGDPALALQRLRDAEQVAIAAGLTPIHPERIHLLIRIAEMEVEGGMSPRAEEDARTALARIGQAGLGDAPIHADALGVLAGSLQYQGRRDAALRVLEEAVETQQRIAPGHPKMAVLLNDLGLLQHRLGRFTEAEATLQRAIERHQAIYGLRHAQTLHAMANRASLLRTWAGPAASAREYERLLPMVEQVLGSAPHSQRVNMLGQLAVARAEAGEQEPALDSARAAWDMHQALPVAQRHRTTWVAGVLGILLFERADAAARELLATHDSLHCTQLETRTALSRKVCIAQALLDADAGACRLPPATPPAPEEVRGAERDWWLAWWMLDRQCGGDPQAADAAIATLGLGRGLPPWLAARVSAARSD